MDAPTDMRERCVIVEPLELRLTNRRRPNLWSPAAFAAVGVTTQNVNWSGGFNNGTKRFRVLDFRCADQETAARITVQSQSSGGGEAMRL